MRNTRRPPASRLPRLWLLATLLLGAGVAAALPLREIRTRGDILAAEARRAAGDAGAENVVVERIGAEVLAFIDESDRIEQTGGAGAHRAELRAAFAALHAPLSAIYRTHAEQIERSSRAVMEEDGDLDALYESTQFQTAQALAASALYHLNWLEYYGARASDGEQRTRLLKSCESGFAQFAVGDHSAELVSESTLGRGLCSLELGHIDWARRDFRAVIDGSGSAERKTVARLALLDAHVRAGECETALAHARELLAGDQVGRDELPLVRLYQLRCLLALTAGDATDGPRRGEVRELIELLRAAGPGWAAAADALLLARAGRPADWAGEAGSPAAQWQRAQSMLVERDCTGAEPLLEKVVAAGAAEPAIDVAEVRYWLAVCQLRGGRHGAAIDNFAYAAAERPGAPYAGDARYLRFKAIEASMASGDAPPALAELYVASLRELTASHPDRRQRDEVHYRLGEYLQGTGDCAGAIDQYTAVAEDADYLLRARFALLQCRFDGLRDERDAAARREMITAIGTDLAAYETFAAASPPSGAAVAEFAPTVALFRALHASLDEAQGDAVAAERLADFAARFPDRPELAGHAARLRLAALLRLQRYEDAEAEARRGGEALRAEGRDEAVRSLAAGFARAARMDEGAAESSAAARVAVALYRLADELAGEAPGLRQQLMIAQLQEIGGDLEAAAVGYEEVRGRNPSALAALRGLARIAEARGRPVQALAYWGDYTGAVTAGDAGWFRGQYEQARLLLAGGDAAGACGRLKALRTAMPGLQDEDLRGELHALYERAGC